MRRCLTSIGTMCDDGGGDVALACCTDPGRPTIPGRLWSMSIVGGRHRSNDRLARNNVAFRAAGTVRKAWAPTQEMVYGMILSRPFEPSKRHLRKLVQSRIEEDIYGNGWRHGLCACGDCWLSDRCERAPLADILHQRRPRIRLHLSRFDHIQ